MRTWFRLAVTGVCVLIAMPTFAQDPTLEERIKRLEQGYQELEEKEKREREGTRPDVVRPEILRPSEPPPEPGIGSLPDVAKDLRRQQQAPLSFGTTGSGRLIYAKPFVASPKAILGGYMDISYTNTRKGAMDNGYSGITGSGLNSSFDQQRFIPFIYADITEHVKMAAELEIEHGIRETSANELEFGLEFAQIDYLVHERFNFRAGIILLPVGKFNLLHDSPLNDLPDRPLVSQFVIPTTMSETGAGFYGTFYPTRISKLDYEFYVTSGPCGNDKTGAPTVNEIQGTRGSRQRKCLTDDGLDINNGKAIVGRMAFSPLLGVEVAGSGYRGSYDPFSKRPLSIWAIDWTLQRGPWELIGEAAWAYIQDNSRALTNNTISTPTISSFAPGSLLTGIGGNSGLGIPPQRMSGYYIQTNYHFMPEFLTRLAPKRFGEGSTFTGVVRWDRVNTNLDNPGGLGDLERLTLGLNFRPVEDTVFKFAYFFDMKATNDATEQRIHNNGIMAMAATYF
ncbi:MAG TPA: hypothetical protein VJV04_02360 [Nitrospiraceae bacterium]|nr:hypothetical protein [Nitrospiraceae bacterium]